MEKLDYKKAFKDLYLPETSPIIVHVPEMKFLLIQGKGNPNEEDGAYQKALQKLYGLSYTIKMSKQSKLDIDGYFDYVVPPLEGLWWMDGDTTLDFKHKENFSWMSMIRLPEFVNEHVFSWACEQFSKKHPVLDLSDVSFTTHEEGLCIQIMHKGAYDEELASIEKMHAYLKKHEYLLDFNFENCRLHHELYLSDARKTKPENLKTVIRLPICEKRKTS